MSIKNNTQYKNAIKRIKRYFYYVKKDTEKLSISNDRAINLFFTEFNLDKSLTINEKRLLILSYYIKKESPAFYVSTRKPRKRKDDNLDYRSKYLNYLQSQKWRDKRQQLFLERGKCCEICGAKTEIQVHHLTYKTLFNEELDHLQVVCKPCHLDIHKDDKKFKSKRKNKAKKLKHPKHLKSGKDRSKIKPINQLTQAKKIAELKKKREERQRKYKKNN